MRGLKRIIYRFILILAVIAGISSCEKKAKKFVTIDQLMEQTKVNNNLGEFSALTIDGYDINYEAVVGNTELAKMDIGFYEFIEGKQGDKPLLRVITKLPEIKIQDFDDYHIELNGEQISHKQYKQIQLKNIIKKAFLKDADSNESVFKIKKKIIRIYTY